MRDRTRNQIKKEKRQLTFVLNALTDRMSTQTAGFDSPTGSGEKLTAIVPIFY